MVRAEVEPGVGDKGRALFSVVVTNYNYAGFLRRSLDSVLAQQGAGPVELIVVDDASTDHSRDVIAEYGGRVMAVLKQDNGGHGGAFNSGFAASHGDLVMFLDADDWLYPDALARIAAAARPGVAQYQYRLDLVDARGTAFDLYPAAEAAFQDGDVRPELMRRGRFATTVTTGLAFSRAALSQVMPMDAEAFRQGGDGYLATVAPLYGEVVTVPGVLGAYCQHGANHSQFAQALAKRARWRLAHDAARYTALRHHAARQGLAPDPEPGLSDPSHLDERIVSLRFEPQSHPYPGDRPQDLARHGLVAVRAAPLPAKRRRVLQCWWLVAGHAPAGVARAAIAWRLAAPSRPAWVDRLAKLARALTGKRTGPKASAA